MARLKRRRRLKDGSAPFDQAERAYGGRAFNLTQYNKRPQRFVEIFGFKVPYSVDELDAAAM
ncbi:hypothetical protein AMC87_CH03126 [Rhizobium phaseoli]|uniref:hypothetical protein n=1 Tax=Rhizobium phaseoli TaxID=396 RepID=UPI0007EA4BD9|nr:hypothetical protein [Rhizobium phaseoli]ANL47784.1 hypothetical protein AMC87_CH03126 [Rhizobium phaseoli]PDS31107.1 hypothetical protein CO650_12045 [Rhizobium phaseoli]